MSPRRNLSIGANGVLKKLADQIEKLNPLRMFQSEFNQNDPTIQSEIEKIRLR
jgi:hypothetical protein